MSGTPDPGPEEARCQGGQPGLTASPPAPGPGLNRVWRDLGPLPILLDLETRGSARLCVLPQEKEGHTHGCSGPVLSTSCGSSSSRFWNRTLNQAVNPWRVPAFLMSKCSSPFIICVQANESEKGAGDREAAPASMGLRPESHSTLPQAATPSIAVVMPQICNLLV